MTEHHSSTAVREPSDGPQPLLATPLVQVPALTYQQLRLLAETAVGVNIGPAQFYFDPAGTLVRSQTDVVADDDVLVPAWDEGKFLANGVRLQVSTSTAPGAGYDLPVGVADAVFWSDAAVQKFLFPYVASCYGDDAGEVLTQVQGAWNYYPADQVKVYALVHMTSDSTGTPLNLGDTVWVAFTEQFPVAKALTAVPIAQFYDQHRPVDRNSIGTPTPPQVDYQRGVSIANPWSPDYLVLRAMAEWAASLRTTAEYFVFPAGTGGFLPPTTSLEGVQSGDIVIPAFTPTVPVDRPYLGSVWFQPQGVDAVADLGAEGDALFWSTASVQQFLFPYYASKGGLEALPDLDDIHRVWTEPQPLEVYGLIHLPSSEWAEVTLGDQHWQPGSLTDGGTNGGGNVRTEVPADAPQTPPADPRTGRVVRRVEPKRQIGVVHADGNGRTAVSRIDRFMAQEGPA